MTFSQPGGRDFKIVLADSTYEVTWLGRIANQHGGMEVDCAESGDLIEATSLGAVAGIGFSLAIAGPGLCFEEIFNLRCGVQDLNIRYIDICPVKSLDSGR